METSEACPQYSENADNITIDATTGNLAATPYSAKAIDNEKLGPKTGGLIPTVDRDHGITSPTEARDRRSGFALSKALEDIDYWKMAATSWEIEAEGWKAESKAEEQRGADKVTSLSGKLKAMEAIRENSNAEWRARVGVAQHSRDAARNEMKTRHAEWRASFDHSEAKLEAANVKTKSRDDQLKTMESLHKKTEAELRIAYIQACDNLALTKRFAESREEQWKALNKEAWNTCEAEKLKSRNREAEWRTWAAQANSNLEIEKAARKTAEAARRDFARRANGSHVHSGYADAEIAYERRNPGLPKQLSNVETKPVSRQWWKLWSGKCRGTK